MFGIDFEGGDDGFDLTPSRNYSQIFKKVYADMSIIECPYEEHGSRCVVTYDNGSAMMRHEYSGLVTLFPVIDYEIGMAGRA